MNAVRLNKIMKQGWEIKKIRDICDKASSNIVQNKISELDGDYPVYGASGYVQNVDFFHRDSPYIGIVKDGAGVGRVNIYPAYSSLLGTLQYIIPKDGYLLEYVAYALKGLNLASYASGATIPHIYFKNYGETEISVAPLAEQEKIVAELDCLSGIIEKKKQQLKEYDALAQSIFYEMFGNPIDNEKGWEVKKLGNVAKVLGGYAFKSTLFVDDGIPLLRIGNINSGVLKTSSIVFYQEDFALEKYIVYPNDLVMSLTGTVGKDDYGNVCVLDKTYPKYYLNQRNAKFVLSDNIVVDYMKYFLKDTQIKSQLTGVNRGVRQGNISNKDIEGLIVPIPPLALQQEFASKIEAIEKQKELIKQSIAETETLFNSRMDYYFN